MTTTRGGLVDFVFWITTPTVDHMNAREKVVLKEKTG